MSSELQTVIMTGILDFETIKRNKQEILKCTDAELIYIVAKFLYDLGQDVKEYERRIIELRDAKVSCEYAKNIATANKEVHEEIVKSSKNPKLCRDFAIYAKQGLDIKELIDIIIDSEDYIYLIDIASRSKLLDIENTRRYILRRILKSKNPVACFLYAIGVEDAPKELLLQVAFINKDPKYDDIREKCTEEFEYCGYKAISSDELEKSIKNYCKNLLTEKATIHRASYFGSM